MNTRPRPIHPNQAAVIRAAAIYQRAEGHPTIAKAARLGGVHPRALARYLQRQGLLLIPRPGESRTTLGMRLYDTAEPPLKLSHAARLAGIAMATLQVALRRRAETYPTRCPYCHRYPGQQKSPDPWPMPAIAGSVPPGVKTAPDTSHTDHESPAGSIGHTPSRPPLARPPQP